MGRVQQSVKYTKKPSKQNRKRSTKGIRSDGEEFVITQNVRSPIIALPEILDSPIYRQWRRFVNNGGVVSGRMNIQDCLNQFMVAVTSVLGICYLRAVRIRQIRILSPVQTQGTSVTLRLQPQGVDSSVNNFNGVPETYVDTSASIDVPAYIFLKPAIDTPLGSWHYSNTVNCDLLNLTCPQGSTMDIQFEYILNHENTASTYTVVIAAATAGTLFSRAILTNFAPTVFTVL